MRYVYLKRIPFIPTFIRKIIRIFYSCDIFPTCEIAPDVQFVHSGLGCVIHERVRIEKGVSIYQNVTLGGNGKINEQTPNCPIIRESAIIYAGACILGPIEIGKNAVIGANAVVLENVPDYAVVVGVPGRVARYINTNRSEATIDSVCKGR